MFARQRIPRAECAAADADADGYEGSGAGAFSTRSRCRTRFPMHAGRIQLPRSRAPGLTPILVHVDTDALHFDVDERKSTYSSRPCDRRPRARCGRT